MMVVANAGTTAASAMYPARWLIACGVIVDIPPE
jgi:hypothetical protein